MRNRQLKIAKYNPKNVKEFVEVYHRNKGLGELVFTSDCLHVEKPDLSGQLKEFYQHLDFDE